VKCSSSMSFHCHIHWLLPNIVFKRMDCIQAIASHLAWTAEKPNMLFDLFFLPFILPPLT
jgi:hypothetical protein